MIEPAFIKRRRGGSREQGTTLVELLVVMVIMSVVTAMILVTWFALQKAYSSTTIATKQREMAQQAMTRMVQEIRDTSGTVGSVAGKGFVVAGPIATGPIAINYYSAFNAPAASRVTTDDGTGDRTGYRPPMGGFYYVWSEPTQDGTLYRWRDTDGSGAKSEGDRVDVLARHVINGRDGTPIFTYICINPSNGTPYHSPPGSLTNLATITSVQITLRIDLNPGHTPTYMDLISTAQPRNNRQT